MLPSQNLQTLTLMQHKLMVCVSSVSQVSADGALTESSMPLAVFTSRAPASGPDVERVSTGTKFALELWLRSLDVPDL